MESGTSAVGMIFGLTGLSANTTYYFRAVGQNGTGTQRGAIVGFTTGSMLPSASTSAASSVTSSAAIANGLSNPNGSSTNSWTEWGTNSSLSSYSSTTAQSIGSGTSAVP